MSETLGQKNDTADPPLRMQAVGLLAAGLAHDLNTMLGGILATADLMAARLPGDSELHDDLSLISGQAERMGTLIRQLLAFSRQEVLKPARVELAGFVTRAAPMLRALVGRHIGLSLPSRRCADVMVDAGALERVLINLVTNARDAIGARPGQISIQCARIEAAALPAAAARFMPSADYAALAVADDGPGVPEALRARVFEPYFTTKPEGQGNGLGLATAYGLVKQSGGFLLLDEDVRRGARFTVYLPLAPATPGETIAAPAAETPPLILLAEDEELLRASARRGLEGAGYKVIAVPDAEHALEAFAAHPSVRLLVSDIRMPGTDGVALARRLKAERPELPVLLMSGYADAAARASLEGLDAGFLAKPFRLAELKASVAAMM